MSAAEQQVIEELPAEPIELLGHYVDMTNEAYHAAPGISKSHLDIIHSQSPMHYWQAYINPDRPPHHETPALLTGKIIHSAILEPDTFETVYAAEPKLDGRTKEGKEGKAKFAADNLGKEIISAADFDIARHVRDAVHRHPVARGLVTGGEAEQTFFAIDKETGALKKCRTDYLIGAPSTGAMIVDLKSTVDASPKDFARSVFNYRYDVQNGWYVDVLEDIYGHRNYNWAFLAFEKEPPFAIGVYYLDKADVDDAREVARKDFHRILECRERNHFPDYGTEIRRIEKPAYLRR